MDNKMDKFFKEKLEAHAVQPSARAWEKVESHLSKKNRIVVWVRVAAAITLLGASAFVALNWDSNKQQKVQIVKDEKPVAGPQPEVKKDVTRQENNQVAEAPVRKQKKSAPKVELKKAVEVPADVPLVVEELEQQEVANTVAVVEAPKKEKGITLTYSLPAVKKPAPEQAEEPTVAEAKKSGLERVLEIAKDVKNADNPLGELREAKDEIFALGFRKDKDKTKKNY
jgi:hypothetical protein